MREVIRFNFLEYYRVISDARHNLKPDHFEARKKLLLAKTAGV